ncbi:hypothetical protein OSB04_009832 [Centaurea solstitialis]|uniref:Cytochrome P450 n=1 Tax=Centaurea solstitialis TaxID=347529 RepID=A0AA38TR83_9ASTR|nr:hypothetical protein OSB04_009832 [Centaurea solstitialis]
MTPSSNTYGDLAIPLALLAVVITVAIWCKKTFLPSKPPLPPGPIGLPLVGYIPFLGPNLHLELYKLVPRYGPIFKLYLGNNLHVVVNSAAVAKVVTGEQDESFANRAAHIAGRAASYDASDIAFADNTVDRRKLRKVLVHEVLSNINLEASEAYRRREVRKTVKDVHGAIGTAIDINEMAFSTVLSVLTNIVWAKSIAKGGKFSNLVAEMRDFVTGVVEIAGEMNLSDFFPTVLAKMDFQGVERRMKNQMKVFDKIFETSVEDRMNSKSAMKEGVDKEEGRKDFLEILLELQQQNNESSLTMTQMKAVIADIFLGGTDATSATIEWAMTEILRNEQVMKKVQDELTEIVGLNNIVEESHLPKLKYLDAVVKETFRLHPPMPFLLPRAPNKSCTVAGYTIPKGSTIFMNVWAIQRDPQYWENPLEFNPERFFNYKGSEKWDYTGTNLKFFPLGSGRRRCPGVGLGEKMMMHVLSSLLHSFDWSLPTGQKLDLSDKFGIALKKQKPLIAIPSPRLKDASLYT